MPRESNLDFVEHFLAACQTIILGELSPKVDDATANDLAERLVMAIVAEFGGTQVYIPLAMRQRLATRNQQILRQYDGTAVSAARLAKQFGVSQPHIARIVAQEVHRRQGEARAHRS